VASHRNGVRHAPFWCAPYSVLLCGLRRFMHNTNANQNSNDNAGNNNYLDDYDYGDG